MSFSGVGRKSSAIGGGRGKRGIIDGYSMGGSPINLRAIRGRKETGSYLRHAEIMSGREEKNIVSTERASLGLG